MRACEGEEENLPVTPTRTKNEPKGGILEQQGELFNCWELGD